MFQKIKAPLLSLTGLMLMAFVLTSCDKNDDEDSGMVQLLSFGPTGAMHGDTLRFIGTNLDKVTAIELAGASVAQAAFVSQAYELIRIIVPKETQQGYVVLKTPAGDLVTKTRLNLNVPVKIASMPAQAKPGENITITGEYMNWVTSVVFAKSKAVDTFVSKSLTQLVVKVPIDAQTGPLMINVGGTEPMQIETTGSLAVALPVVTSISPLPVEREKNLTITGTNLEFTKGVLFKGMTLPDSVFVSKSSTQLVIKVPAKANKGKITLVAYSLVTVESAQSLTFVGDLPDLAPLKYAFYIDGLQSPWQNWGWSSTADFVNAENVRDGVASIKMDYTGTYGALKFANGSVATGAYTHVTFSIFGTPGTGGKKINVTPNGGKAFSATIEEGKWVEFTVPKADMGMPATMTDLTFQNQDWTGKVYIDHVGFR